MQTAKETAAKVAASARSGMEKTKATAMEKAEQVKTRDPLVKDMATQKKEAKIQDAERQKHEAHGHMPGTGHTGVGHMPGTGHKGVGHMPGTGHKGVGHMPGTGHTGHAI